MTNIDTKYGVIHISSPGPFQAYDNINIYHQTSIRYVQLQGPALRAFKVAEARIATRKKRFILITGHGYRDYDSQRALFASDPGRFASPDGSMHVEGLAVDVDQGQGRFRLRQIRKALEEQGWHYPLVSEPWHASFHVSG